MRHTLPGAIGQSLESLDCDVAPLDMQNGHVDHKHHVEHPRDVEQLERAHVVTTDALAHPWTVVVVLRDAYTAVVAVFRVEVLLDAADVAVRHSRSLAGICAHGSQRRVSARVGPTALELVLRGVLCIAGVPLHNAWIFAGGLVQIVQRRREEAHGDERIVPWQSHALLLDEHARGNAQDSHCCHDSDPMRSHNDHLGLLIVIFGRSSRLV